jgi:hypothetical protein
VQSRAAERFNSNDVCSVACRGCDAGVETAATDGDDESLNAWFVLKDLLGERAGPCCDLEVVVRVA